MQQHDGLWGTKKERRESMMVIKKKDEDKRTRTRMRTRMRVEVGQTEIEHMSALPARGVDNHANAT